MITGKTRCFCSYAVFMLNTNFFLDLYLCRHETSWNLTGNQGGPPNVIDSGANYDDDTFFQFQNCVDDNGCYTLTILDSYGDGFCCGGNPSFELLVNGNQLVNETQGTANINFDDSFDFDFGNCNGQEQGPGPTSEPTPAPITPVPTLQPTPAPTSPDNGEQSCTEMILDIDADSWGEEIGVTLVDESGNVLFSQEGLDDDVTTTFTESCLDMSKCSTLRITDSYGDGLLHGGKFVLYLDGVVAMEGSDYGDGVEMRLGLPCTGHMGQ